MDRVFRFVTEHAWWVLGLALVGSLVAVSRVVDVRTGSWQLEFDQSLNRLLPEDDEGKKFYDHVRLVFGSDETILIAYHTDDLFTPEHLGNMRRMTQRIGEADGVHHVTSLVNARNILGDAGGLSIEPLFKEIPTDPDELARLRETALASSIFAGKFLSEDATTGVLLVYLRDYTGDADQQPIDDEIVRIAQEERGSAEVWITGQPHVKVAQYRAQIGELRRNVPLILLIFAVVLAASFRTVRGVVLPLLAVVLSLLWTLGTAAWIGRPLNLVTVLFPLVLLILGLSYAVHVVSEFYNELREEPGGSPRKLVYAGLRKVWLPVALTGLTTGVGFFAMMLHPLGAIREVGLLLLIGIGFAVLASLSVLPALLVTLPKPRRLSAGWDPEGRDLFSRFAERIGGFVLNRRRLVLATTAAVFVFFASTATQIAVTTDGIRSFSPSAPVRIDFEAINAALGGANGFNVIVEASYRDAFKEPDNLREIEALQSWLKAQPEIGDATSIVDFISIINRGFHADDPAYEVIPDSRKQVASLLFFGANDDLDGFIDGRYQMVNIVVRTTLQRSSDIQALTARIYDRVVELPPQLKGTVTGNPIVIQSMVDEIIRGQVRSVLAALGLIFLILWALFTNWNTGLRALIPNVLPVVAFFGGMGLFGIPLSTSTSLIAPMALGIAIDDTLHYFIRFQEDAKRLADERVATVRALRTVGRPMTYTTLTLCLGFLVLTSSELANQMHFGVMAAFTLGFAWVVDFTVTPALCAGLRVVTLWDTLTLDLGQSPEQSIPLFAGLTKRQCRILALTASVRSIPAGEPVFRTGDPGGEMYVVIDGKLRNYIDTDQGPRDLSTHARGNVTGIVGVFGRRRSINVDVMEDARLLRLTPKNMAELARRRPAIATVLLRNLGDQLAGLVFDGMTRERDLAEQVATQQS